MAAPPLGPSSEAGDPVEKMRISSRGESREWGPVNAEIFSPDAVAPRDATIFFQESHAAHTARLKCPAAILCFHLTVCRVKAERGWAFLEEKAISSF